MLLPDNIHPDHSIYYISSFLLEQLHNNSTQSILDLYENVINRKKISFPVYILCLDWLYLIGVAELNSRGDVQLCS